MAVQTNYTEKKKELIESISNLFKTMRRYKPGNGLTVSEKTQIIEAVIKDMTDEWELYQSLTNKFNL